MKILTILQARMTSTRLPGKVLRPLQGAPMLERQIERLRRSQRLGQLIIATSADPSDDPIEACGAALNCPVYRGALADVLQRYCGAIEAFGPVDHVVRVTGDCPLTDWTILDQVIALHLDTDADYTSNTVDRTYAKGLDVEVFKAPLLLDIPGLTDDAYDHEHVTPFLYRNPDRYRIAQLTQSPDRSQIRWTVDTPSDYRLAQAIYGALYDANPAFTAADIEALGWTLEADPDVALHLLGHIKDRGG